MTPSEILAKLYGGEDWVPEDYPAIGVPLPDLQPSHTSDLAVVPSHESFSPDPTPHRTQAVGKILYALGLTQRPLGAIANAYLEAKKAREKQEDPSSAFVQGAKSGWLGETDTDFGDVLGIPRPESSDTWPAWLAKGAGHIAANIPADPLSYVGAPARAGGVVGPALLKAGIPEGRSLIGQTIMKGGGERALNTLGGTNAWSLFAREAPNTEKYRKLNEIWRLVKREGTTDPVDRAVVEAETALKTQFPDIDRAGLLNAWEAQKTPNEFREPLKLLETLATQQRIQRDRYADFLGKVSREGAERPGPDVGLIKMPGEGQYAPHILSAEGNRQFLRENRRSNMDPAAWNHKQRQVQAWLDSEGDTVAVGKLKDKRTRVEQTDDGGFVFIPPNDEIPPIPVQPFGSTLEQTKAISGAGKSWEQDPVRAFGISAKRYNQKANFLDYFKRLGDEGFIQPIERDKLDEIVNLLPGKEQLNLPGFKDYQADPAVARELEKKFLRFFNPNASMSEISGRPSERLLPMAEGLSNLIHKTRGGQIFSDLTSLFKRNVLGSPAFVTGNVVSDASMEAAAMTSPGWNFPARYLESIQAMRGSPKEIGKSGMSLADFADEMSMQGLNTSMAQEASRDLLTGEPVKQTSEWLRKLRLPESVVSGGQKAADLMGDYNKFWLNIAGKTEDRHKISTALDYFRAHEPEYNAMRAEGDTEGIKRLFANAAHLGHKGLDYDALPPFGSRVANKVVPFWNFQSGIMENGLDLAINNPAKLRRLDDMYNLIAMPVSNDDQSIMDPWMVKQIPIQGLFGKTFDDMMGPSPGGRRMAFASRFVPWAFAGDIVGGDSPLGINPYLKAGYELPTNTNLFRGGQPIDKLAGGALQGLWNSIQSGMDREIRPYESATHQYFGYTPSATADYLLNISPISRHLREANKLSQIGGYLWKDPYRPDVSVPETALDLISGARFYPFDEDKAMKRRSFEYGSKVRALKSSLKYLDKKTTDPATGAATGDKDTYNRYIDMLNELQKQAPKKSEPRSSLSSPIVNMARADASSEFPYYIPESEQHSERALSFTEIGG